MQRKNGQGKKSKSSTKQMNNIQQQECDPVEYYSPPESPPGKVVHPEDVPQQHVEFLSRVADMPVVQSAIEYASDAYIKAKDLSPTLIKKTWSTAEETVNYAARCALHVCLTQNLENTQVVQAVDQLACKTLDKVEETLPVMTKTTGEIMSYVNNKIFVVTDTLLNNSLGRFALGSMEMSVSTVDSCIDFLLPPTANEDDDPKSLVIPIEPSKKILWSIRRTFGAFSKVQHRLSCRTNGVLHALSLNGLLILGTVVNLFEWVQLNWKEMMTTGLPSELNKLANVCRKSSGVELRPASAVDDVVILAKHLINRAVEVIQGALSAVAELADSQAVKDLKTWLSVALETCRNFISRISQVVTSKDALDEANIFLCKDFPAIYGAMTTVTSWFSEPKVKAHLD